MLYIILFYLDYVGVFCFLVTRSIRSLHSTKRKIIENKSSVASENGQDVKRGPVKKIQNMCTFREDPSLYETIKFELTRISFEIPIACVLFQIRKECEMFTVAEDFFKKN